MSEEEVIARIWKIFGGVPVPDDDCWYDGESTLWTVDGFVEGVDFLRDWDGVGVGYRSLVLAAADVVASGGVPRGFLNFLAFPADEEEFSFSVVEGFSRAAEDWGLKMKGGDVSSADGIILSFSVFGNVVHKYTPRGHRGEGVIFSTDLFGLTGLALRKLMNDEPLTEEEREAFFYPRLPVEEGVFLSKWALAMTDVSDGLLRDVARLTGGAEVNVEVAECFHPAVKFREDWLELALSSGETAALIVVLREGEASDVRARYERKFQKPLFFVGKAGGSEVVFKRGEEVLNFREKGYLHFSGGDNRG